MRRVQLRKPTVVTCVWNRVHGHVGAALRAVGPVTCAVFLSACGQPYNPFQIPFAELRSRVSTIALAPLNVRADLVNPEFARAQIEPLITAQLEAGGFRVIPSDEMERLWQRSVADVGAVYNPISGERDQNRFDAVREAVYRDLRVQYHADAVLYVRISPVDLSITGTTVSYCGLSSDKIYWPASGLSFGELTTFITALCLDTALYDLEGRDLYNIRHGLETVETYVRQTRAVKPIDERLRDRARLVQAVEATVGPLAGHGKNAKP